MTHPLSNTLFSKDHFFRNPDKVVELSKKQEYLKSAEYPGYRTLNLLESADPTTKNFGLYIAQRLSKDVFPGISKFLLDVRFHKNETYPEEYANNGWVHSDESDIAGIVYLNKGEENFDSGTSIFLKKTTEDFSCSDFKSRQQFNLNSTVTAEYLEDLKSNRLQFTETVRIGNVYNRLVTYDAKRFHGPNNYNTSTLDPRLSLLFFIEGYSYAPVSLVNINSFWVD